MIPLTVLLLLAPVCVWVLYDEFVKIPNEIMRMRKEENDKARAAWRETISDPKFRAWAKHHINKKTKFYD